MKYFLSALILALNVAHAMPRSVEFWFFSPKEGMADALIFKPSVGLKLAQNFDCVPMGEGCFNPQLGYIPSSSEVEAEKKSKSKDTYVKPTLDTDLIDCDKNYYFDLYCGEAKKKKVTGTEVWIDISTSMRRIAPGKAGCPQSQFVKDLQNKCPGISFSVFNTRVFPLNSADQTCSYMGLNDRKRMVDEIRSLEADRLVVITDIDEYAEDLRAFIDREFITAQGLNSPLYIEKINVLAAEMSKKCHQ